MKKTGLLLTAMALCGAMACNEHNDEEYNALDKTRASAENLTKEQAGKLIEKDSVISDFLISFNEIQSNLEEIKQKENIISVSRAGNAESASTNKEQIVQDINSIKELMQKNKDRLSTLQSKLKNSNFKNEALQKLVERLTNDVKAKDEQIAQLQEQLTNSNEAFKDLLSQYDKKNEVLEKTNENLTNTTDKLQTAYYAYGTSKELKTNGVITKDGGFIGLGKTEHLAKDFNKKYFTKANIKELKTIALNCKKAKLLTTHPSTSYKLTTKDKKVESIDITDEEEFWSASKYLVIEIDN
jgi:DNA repair exonuclease SbcCD ATPase subunit